MSGALSTRVGPAEVCGCAHRADQHDETGHCVRGGCGCERFHDPAVPGAPTCGVPFAMWWSPSVGIIVRCLRHGHLHGLGMGSDSVIGVLDELPTDVSRIVPEEAAR